MDNLEENNYKLEELEDNQNLTGHWLLEAIWSGGAEHAKRYINENVWVNIYSNKMKEFNQIRVNDVVAVKTSITKRIEDDKFISAIKIKAIGIVTKNLNDGRHLEIDWNVQIEEPEIDNIIKNEAIHKVNNVDEINNIFYQGKEVYKPFIEKSEIPTIPKVKEANLSDKIEKAMINEAKKRINRTIPFKEKKTNGYPLNQIFYGSSGTGKTFKTISSALEIIDGFFPENFEEAKRKFDSYKALGQIGFITFHESYNYSDFIEGLSTISDINGNKEYKVKSGVFKEMANLARVELLSADTRIDFDPEDETINFYKATIGNNSRERDDQTYNYCLEKGYIALDMLGGIDYSILENTQEWEQAQEEINEIYFFEQPTEQKRLGIQSIYFFKNFMKRNDLVFISNDDNRITSIGRISGRYEFFDLPGVRYHHFRKVEWIIKECSIPSEKFYDRKFSEQIIYQLSKKHINKENLLNFIGKSGSHKRNYVLIIDEINKGDIKNIFGEAFTLIDPQKRLGQLEEMKIRLPYSNDELGVPDNFYIIGTMNTSIKLDIFDQGLRRRFDFIELNINYDILNFKIDGIEIDKLLKKINQRLAFLEGEQVEIGHSYFIELKDNPSFETLKNIFKNKIIPLLQYFLKDDMNKISLLLGDNQKKENDLKFIQEEKINTKKLFGANSKLENKSIYKINYPDNPKAYIYTYQK